MPKKLLDEPTPRQAERSAEELVAEWVTLNRPKLLADGMIKERARAIAIAESKLEVIKSGSVDGSCCRHLAKQIAAEIANGQ